MQQQNNDKLTARAHEKQGLIEKFLELAQEQAAAIKNENYDTVLNTINRKQNIIEQVNLLDLNFPAAGEEDSEAAKLLNQRTAEIMAQAIAIENQNIRALKNRQAEIFQKLKNTQTGKLTHSLYRGGNASLEGILLDKKK